MTALNPTLQHNLDQFLIDVFDVRLRLAIKDQTFASTAAKEQKRRAHIWLQHYGKIAYNLLPADRPPYNIAYPEILNFLASKSKYYPGFATGRYAPKENEQ